ncbi:MAG: TetR/AcrR family transcriptional regulator [Verrucomicrobia bacterium]|nr:TetR/AcrR family transcriptional regulator [Verrucomicrobiota bacterium]
MKSKNEFKNKNAGEPDATTAGILRAALELGEELGFDGLTVEGIAARSGIAKTTIYRRWANVGAIVMDAFLTDVTWLAPMQVRSTARESLRASMLLLARAYRGRLGKILRPLLGRAQTDEGLREAVRTRWVEPRRQVARKAICHGMQTGELRPALDPDVVLDALYGPFYHRLLVPYKNSAITDTFVNALVDTVFGGLEQAGAAKATVQSDPHAA